MTVLTVEELDRLEPLAIQREIEGSRQNRAQLAEEFDLPAATDEEIAEHAEQNIRHCFRTYREWLAEQQHRPESFAGRMTDTWGSQWFGEEFPAWVRRLEQQPVEA